jgi:DNA-binding NarL/FixJ family response regulator
MQRFAGLNMEANFSKTIHVLVADNARMYTELLADALGRDQQIKVVSTGSDSRKIKEAIREKSNIDVAVLGANLDEVPLQGIALLRELHNTRPEIKGVVLLDSSKREVILEAFRAGARGLFSRHEPLETLGKCVRQVHAGQVWANSEQLTYAVEALAAAPMMRAVDSGGLSMLSKRELEVVKSLAEGLTNREIASRLGLSQHTIKNYLFRIFDKLGVSSRMELLFLTLHPRSSTTFHPEAGIQLNGNATEQRTVGWYLNAAHGGSTVAQIALARMYSHGEGVSPNPVEAYFWYAVCERSCTEISSEANEAKKQLEAMLTPEQILEARKKATEKLAQAHALGRT